MDTTAKEPSLHRNMDFHLASNISTWHRPWHDPQWQYLILCHSAKLLSYSEHFVRVIPESQWNQVSSCYWIQQLHKCCWWIEDLIFFSFHIIWQSVEKNSAFLFYVFFYRKVSIIICQMYFTVLIIKYTFSSLFIGLFIYKTS